MPKNLLLADDSITIQKVVGITFASEDYKVISVDNGEDAINKAREVRPDVILADVVMPRKNGYEVCEAVKGDPSLKSIPVLLLAGTFEAFDEARARSARADGHISKPFESQALINKVRELVEGKAPAAGVAPLIARPGGPGQPAAGPGRPSGPGMPPGAVRPPGPGMSPGVARPPGPGMPPGAARPPGPGMPPGVRPPGPAIPLGAPRPQGPGMPPGAVRPPGPGMPPGARPPGPAMPLGAPRPPGPGMPPGVRPPGSAMPPGARPPGPGLSPARPAPVPPGPGLGAAPPPAAARPTQPAIRPAPAPSPAPAAPRSVPQKDPFGLGGDIPAAAAPEPSVPDLSWDDGAPAPSLELSLDDDAPAAGSGPVRSSLGLDLPEDAGGPELAPMHEFVPPAAATGHKPAAPPPGPVPSSAGAGEGRIDNGERALREALSSASREVIERVVWEVVPQLAETIIRENLDRLVKGREK